MYIKKIVIYFCTIWRKSNFYKKKSIFIEREKSQIRESYFSQNWLSIN